MDSTYLKEIEKTYIGESDWEIKENANKNKSFSNFISYYIKKTLNREDILNLYFPSEIVKLHINKTIHIHKLPLSLFIPYCAGWSYPKLLRMGLITPTLISKPAKHFMSAVNHLVNFIFLAAQEWTGAMAMSAFDLYSAPFAEKDKLNEKEVEQILQSMLFELNYPSRMGFQSPFSNITIMLDTVKNVLEDNAIINGKSEGKLIDYLDKAELIVRKLIELYNEGDGKGNPFTFPIPTLMLTKNFDWNGRRWGEITDLIFENLSKRGSFYILNGYSSNVEALYAMCCRLTIDTSKVFKIKKTEDEVRDVLENNSIRGMWAIPDATGSIGVITINLPRLAFESKGDMNLFFDLLDPILEKIRNTLKIMRERYENSLNNGLMPLTKVYLGTLYNHFSTVGLVGLPEAAANFLNPDLWKNKDIVEIKKAVKWMKEVVSYVRKKTERWEEEDNILYNVEEVPAESTGYRMAMKDYRKYKKYVESGDFFIPMENGVPFYSNSIIPYYVDIPIFQRALFEGEVQQEFTGGVMMHLFLHEVPDPHALKKMIHKIVLNTKVVYFSITPTIAVCSRCGWTGIGVIDRCPRCGSPVELWSRIVGYYRPVSSWNLGKKAEFRLRVHY